MIGKKDSARSVVPPRSRMKISGYVSSTKVVTIGAENITYIKDIGGFDLM